MWNIPHLHPLMSMHQLTIEVFDVVQKIVEALLNESMNILNQIPEDQLDQLNPVTKEKKKVKSAKLFSL